MSGYYIYAPAGDLHVRLSVSLATAKLLAREMSRGTDPAVYVYKGSSECVARFIDGKERSLFCRPWEDAK